VWLAFFVTLAQAGYEALKRHKKSPASNRSRAPNWWKEINAL